MGTRTVFCFLLKTGSRRRRRRGFRERKTSRERGQKNSLFFSFGTKKHHKKNFLGGKTVALGPDEYVFASLSIYLDVINIFLMILQLVAAFQRE